MAEMQLTNPKAQITLSKKTDDMVIEVIITNEFEFSEAYTLLMRLHQRAKIEKHRTKFESLWEISGDQRFVKEAVTDGVNRVALSLLEEWPECKRPKSIQDETGLSSGSVSNILVGRQGHCGDWFLKCSEGWTLSEIGVSNILDKLESDTVIKQMEE